MSRLMSRSLGLRLAFVAPVLMAGIMVAVMGSAASSSAKARAPIASAALAKGKLTFIMVSQAPSTITFWDTVYHGLVTAGKNLGVNVKYLGTPANLTDPSIEAKNIETAIAEHPSGIIVSDPSPSVLNPYIKKIAAAGIPFIMNNSGIGNIDGQLAYIGNNEFASGEAAGKQMKALGVKHALVLDTPPGQIPLVDQRVSGFRKGFGGHVTIVQVPTATINDPTTLEDDYRAALQKNASIDGAFSIGSCCTASLLAAKSSLGRKVTLGAIDVVPQTVTALKHHQLSFVNDQQPFDEGYLPAVYLYQYLRYGMLPATSNIYTGPVVYTAANAGKLVAGEAAGTQ